MLHILEFLTGFYWILIPQFIVESLIRGRGAVFYVDMQGNWNGRRIKNLLASYDIPMWGWGYAFGQFYFRVPAAEAKFAQSVMQGAGVDLQ
jgi:hypothetical protein